MNPAAPLASLAPVPMSSPSYPPTSEPPPMRIPDRPASTGTQWTSTVQAAGPIDIRNVRASCLFGLREYVTLQRKRQHVDGSTSAMELESRIRGQANLVAGDLRTLQSEIRGLAKAAEDQRWRRWLLGGVIAAFIPAVRSIFRRGFDEQSHASANDTEYAFHRSKGLMARIRDGILGSGKLAKVAFFVFAVLYVFQNEVTLRAARTTQRRLRRLCERIERGDADMDDKDIAVLEGWRWRILFW
ncbi:hypothetical protein HRG_008910 [Hirsutella rhossiliensis]|uniref:Uncharacterized protein n=1 Tax=Hirsutella rhossiliensis TaxID=111463 RepID=A0A9P8MRM5_9HYPO|nr:uncharacterized protein HRG_08910 [Hirsutella rhossiliensis]KAH0959889.1 hypothetical protein HRG_08910 [Hirsutella rhossiliensis]